VHKRFHITKIAQSLSVAAAAAISSAAPTAMRVHRRRWRRTGFGGVAYLRRAAAGGSRAPPCGSTPSDRDIAAAPRQAIASQLALVAQWSRYLRLESDNVVKDGSARARPRVFARLHARPRVALNHAPPSGTPWSRLSGASRTSTAKRRQMAMPQGAHRRRPPMPTASEKIVISTPYQLYSSRLGSSPPPANGVLAPRAAGVAIVIAAKGERLALNRGERSIVGADLSPTGQQQRSFTPPMCRRPAGFISCSRTAVSSSRALIIKSGRLSMPTTCRELGRGREGGPAGNVAAPRRQG